MKQIVIICFALTAAIQAANKFPPVKPEPGIFEGDIKLSPDQRKAVENAIKSQGSIEKSSEAYGLTNVYPAWTNGVVVYSFASTIGRAQQKAIYAAMSEWTTRTDNCITFKKRTTERNYLEFFVHNGCWGHIGMPNGKSQISVGRGCEHRHVMTHEIGHALGFWHEQSRPDRDTYVEILWSNVPSQFKEAFAKYGRDKIDSLGVPYDYGSIMHYPWNAFSTTGRNTLKPRKHVPRQPYQTLSDSDVKQAKLFYKCDGTKPPVVTKRPPVRPTKCEEVWETVEIRRPYNPNCRDQNGLCSQWAQNNECTRNPGYMKVYCCQSCSQKSSCSDRNRYCSDWARKNECNKNPGYMHVHCRKSCKLCSTTTKKKVLKCYTLPPPPTTQPETTTLMPPIPTTVPEETTTAKPPVPPTTVPPTTTLVPPPPTGTVAPPPTGVPPLPSDCDSPKPVGIEDSTIPDSALSASSSDSKWQGPAEGRLNKKAGDSGVGAWCAAVNDKKQYFQVDLGSTKLVKKVAVQGRDSAHPSYVTKYIVSYSDDGNKWTNYVDTEAFFATKIFTGNSDGTTVKEHMLDLPILARYIRFNPSEWHSKICLRVELYHCV